MISAAVCAFIATLQEENAADEKLTQIAESVVNADAGQGESEEDEGEEEDAGAHKKGRKPDKAKNSARAKA